MEKIFPLTSDIVFKAVFGQDTIRSKENLVNLLNAILVEQNHVRIKSVDIRNPFLFGFVVYEKSPILDISARLDNDEQVNIEIQVKDHDNFLTRMVYNMAKLHSKQLGKGDDYGLINKTIHIHIVDFSLLETEKVHSCFRLLEIEEIEEYYELTDELELHCLQLPNLGDKLKVEEMDHLTMWLSFIKNQSDPEYQEQIQAIVKQEEVIGMALEEYKKVTEDERLWYDMISLEKAEFDRKAILETEKRISLEEGIEKGEKNKSTEIAKSLLQEGASIEMISRATGLSMEELEALSED